MLATLLGQTPAHSTDYRLDAGARNSTVVPTVAIPDAGASTDAGQPFDGGLVVDEREAPNFRAGIELALTSYPSGPVGGEQDLLGDVTPLLGIEAGDDFGIELGATFRFRLLDEPPAQRSHDLGGMLRAADWNEASDFGQIIRSLRIAQDDTVLAIRAGRFRKYTLGFGHLLNRYSNQDNPDYHPAGAWIRVGAGPLRAEAFASDLFGARIFAGEAALDFGAFFRSTPETEGRYHLAVSVAHDAGQAGGRMPAVSLMHVDVSAVLYRSSDTRALLLTGFGFRLAHPVDGGLLFGGAFETALGSLKFAAKAEIRKQNGGFRQGFFGPVFELSRYAGSGFSGESRLTERLPDTFSGYGEIRLGVGQAFSFDASAEYFGFGRADLDAALALEALSSRLTLTLRGAAVALNVLPRYSGTLEARVRMFRSFYVLGYGGTVFIPQPDSTLSRGGYGGIGCGFDVEL